MKIYIDTLYSMLSIIEDSDVNWSSESLESVSILIESLPIDIRAASNEIWSWCEHNPEMRGLLEDRLKSFPTSKRLPGDGKKVPEIQMPKFRNTLRNGVLNRKKCSQNSTENDDSCRK